MPDVSPPQVIPVSPFKGSSEVHPSPDFVFRIVDVGTPAVGINASSIEVRVMTKPLGGEWSNSLLIFDNLQVVDGSGWSTYSHAWAGDLDSTDYTEATALQGNPLEGTLVLTKNTSFSFEEEVKFSIVASDSSGNTVGDPAVFPLYYKIAKNPVFGSDTSATLDSTDIETFLATPFSNSLVENLRLALLRCVMAETPLVGNWQFRAARRLVQVLSRIGRETLINSSFPRAVSLSEGAVFGAAPLRDIESNQLDLFASLVPCRGLLTSLADSNPVRVSTTLQLTVDSEAQEDSKWSPLVEGALTVVYLCMLRSTYPGIIS